MIHVDPIDSIMMLADQACQKSPIRNRGGGSKSIQAVGLNNNKQPGDDATFLNTGSFERRVSSFYNYCTSNSDALIIIVNDKKNL